MYPKSRYRLNPQFVAACGESAIPKQVQAKHCGFSQPQTFSSLLHAQVVSLSPKTMVRLKMVASLIGFYGPLFVEEFPPATPDQFDRDDLPGPGR
jgi:hypothetical protein